MAYFGVPLNSVKNILKAIPEAQYSCSRSMVQKNSHFAKAREGDRKAKWSCVCFYLFFFKTTIL